MDTNIGVLLLVVFDFGAKPHRVPSEVFYSRPFVAKEFALFPANRCLALSRHRSPLPWAK
jgi:hypothetical protein